MKTLRVFSALVQILWRRGIARSKSVLLTVLGMDVATQENLDDLMVTKDVITLQLYRQAAEQDGTELREFLLKYHLATIKRKGID